MSAHLRATAFYWCTIAVPASWLRAFAWALQLHAIQEAGFWANAHLDAACVSIDNTKSTSNAFLIIYRKRRLCHSNNMAEDLSEIKITDRMSLKDKNFLVTGGARGIGFAVCKSIAQLGIEYQFRCRTFANFEFIGMKEAALLSLTSFQNLSKSSILCPNDMALKHRIIKPTSPTNNRLKVLLPTPSKALVSCMVDLPQLGYVLMSL